MPDTESRLTKSLPDLQWRELLAQHRATDDISFKLLGFVPLFSVAAITGILLKTESKMSLALIVVSFVGAVSTLGFWIWERRNIQTCLWLRDRAADIERATFGPAYVGQFARFPTAPHKLGKTEAEKIVYAATLIAWLLVPLATISTSELGNAMSLLIVHAIGAVAISLLAWRELSIAISRLPTDAD